MPQRGRPSHYYRARQAATADAPRAGLRWEAWEEEFWADESMTAQGVAIELGRTTASVHNKRRNRRGGGLGRGTGQAPACG